MTTVWVTGAARSIGAAVAADRRAAGARVVGIDRDPVLDVDVALAWDLSRPSDWSDALIALAADEPPSAIVHAAGVQPIHGAGDADLAAWVNTLVTNVVSVDLLVGAGRGALAAQGGSVVVVSSVHARATTAGAAVYATSKAAMEGWARAAALDLAPGIRVNAVVPGAVDTPMLRTGFARWPETPAQERLDALAEGTPLRRIATASEIARVITFMLGDDSRFMTGSSVVVDGGVLARLGSE